MCGIGAIVPSRDYEPNDLKRIAVNLLRYLEARGTDAAGIAVFYDDGRVWLRKAPLPGSVFAKLVERVPWERAGRVTAVLIHDRAATSCSPRNNECNHPLWELTEDGRLVAMVHNGVLNSYPAEELRRPVDSDALLVGVRRRGRLSVDAVLETLSLVSGSYAAIWSDGEVTLTARNSNPLAYTVVDTVGAVLASTPDLLAAAIYDAEIDGYDPIEMLGTCRLYAVRYWGVEELETIDGCKSSEWWRHWYKYYEYYNV